MSSSESGSSLTVTCGDGEPAAAMAVDEEAEEAPDEVATPLAAAAIETELTTTLLARPLLKETFDCWFLPSWLKKSSKVLAFTCFKNEMCIHV